MDNKCLYGLLDDLLENASKEQIKKFLTKIIIKFPDNQNKEIFSLINEIFKDEIQNINLENLDEKIINIEKQFNLI